MTKRVVIAGGSGFLGQCLKRYLSDREFEVKILTRNPSSSSEIQWDARSIGDWAKVVDGSFALINMAGRTVDCRYTRTNRKQILDSRIESTKVLHQAVASADFPPQIWLNSSTSTIYRDTRGEAPANTEATGKIGDDFSMSVAKAWEKEFFRVQHVKTSQTALRTAIVMGNSGGAFPVMNRIANFGLCSPQGPGDQWISWLHINDFCRAVEALMEKPMAGCVNLCSPHPIQNREFNRLLKEFVKPWFTLPQPVWLLKLGAIFLRTETELILKSRKVVPERLLESGFEFRYPTCESMLKDLLRGE